MFLKFFGKMYIQFTILDIFNNTETWEQIIIAEVCKKKNPVI
jgi:hypothetical protein